MVEPRGKRVSVASPAYNEAETIESVVTQWMEILSDAGLDWEIVIADDGSTDGTTELLDRLAQPRVRPLHLERNLGYGHALAQAIRAGEGDYIVTIDSDGQFNLGDALPMIERISRDGLDLVTGYRRRKQDSALKVVADRVLNLLVRLTFGLPYRDTNCALKVLTRQAARKLPIEAVGFPTPTEIMVRAAHAGLKMAESPVDHLPRSGGKSKLKALQSGFDFILFLGYLRLQTALRNRRVIQEPT